MRVRGLKLQFAGCVVIIRESHPMRVRGLKLSNVVMLVFHEVSHPMRVRGLKPIYTNRSRSRGDVAPHAGAWIETVR